MEIRFYEDPNDYLLYGMTEELLCREGERWLEMNLKSFYAAYGNRLLIIQAHPNREGSSAPAPVQLLHGMERSIPVPAMKMEMKRHSTSLRFTRG